MTGTTFAVSWCASLRGCAVAGHDLRKTLTQTSETRAIVRYRSVLTNPVRQSGSSGVIARFEKSLLGAWIARVNCFGAFFSL
jgi:hypothetical protein